MYLKKFQFVIEVFKRSRSHWCLSSKLEFIGGRSHLNLLPFAMISLKEHPEIFWVIAVAGRGKSISISSSSMSWFFFNWINLKDLKDTNSQINWRSSLTHHELRFHYKNRNYTIHRNHWSVTSSQLPLPVAARSLSRRDKLFESTSQLSCEPANSFMYLVDYSALWWPTCGKYRCKRAAWR